MPWTKYVDMRINKGIRLGRADITAFADFRNLLNFKNIIGLFAETDDVVNGVFQEVTLSPQFSNLRIEAQQNGHLLTGGSIDLRPDCGSWAGSTAGPVNCVVLRQVESRFGERGRGVHAGRADGRVECVVHTVQRPADPLRPAAAHPPRLRAELLSTADVGGAR